MSFCCAAEKVVDVCSARGLYSPYILVLCLKWSLYFILCQFAVLTFINLSWPSSLLKWALCPTMDEPVNLIYPVWWSPLSPFAAVSMNKVNIFFCSEMTAIWPTSYIIRFSYLEAMSTFILLSFDNIVDILSKAVVVLIVFNAECWP